MNHLPCPEQQIAPQFPLVQNNSLPHRINVELRYIWHSNWVLPYTDSLQSSREQPGGAACHFHPGLTHGAQLCPSWRLYVSSICQKLGPLCFSENTSNILEPLPRH